MIKWKVVQRENLNRLGLEREYPEEIIMIDVNAKRPAYAYLFGAEEFTSEKQLGRYGIATKDEVDRFIKRIETFEATEAEELKKYLEEC